MEIYVLLAHVLCFIMLGILGCVLAFKGKGTLAFVIGLLMGLILSSTQIKITDTSDNQKVESTIKKWSTTH